MKKKGISGIVTTMLIVLISVAAVLVIWGVVKLIITETTDELTANFIGLNVKIDQATQLGSNLFVRLSRNAGGGLAKLHFVIKNSEDSQTFTSDRPMAELSTKTFPIPLEISDPNYLEIYPVVLTESGKEKVGPRLDAKSILVLTSPLEEELPEEPLEEELCPLESTDRDGDGDADQDDLNIVSELMAQEINNPRVCNTENNWCDYLDINQNGNVNFVDLARFVSCFEA